MFAAQVIGDGAVPFVIFHAQANLVAAVSGFLVVGFVQDVGLQDLQGKAPGVFVAADFAGQKFAVARDGANE